MTAEMVNEDPTAYVAPVDQVQTHHYDKPILSGIKESRRLGKTSYSSCRIQVLNEGGENNLHSHVGNDGFWYVKKGGVRFYTTDDVIVAELHENEGFVTPRGFKYWFEAIPGEDDLELMRFGASTFAQTSRSEEGGRVNHEELKPNQLRLLQKKDEIAYDLLDAKS